MYKILADENIPYAAEAFSEIGRVQLINGRDITNTILKTIDILIIRSITRVDENLLHDTAVKFVGTTTIGSDHVDMDYLARHNIGFASAPGCNADSVAEYIFAGLLKTALEEKSGLNEKSIGIIGYGNIGSRVARIAQSFSMKILINDPPLERKTGESFFIPYEEALQADIITYHVPLNMTGPDKTYHMLSYPQLKNFNDNKVLINASRGSVTANHELKNFLEQRKCKVILDVWENEPRINTELLDLAYIGTSHIAGYSLEGKVNGTIMIYDSLCRFLNHKKAWKPDYPVIENPLLEYPDAGSPEESLALLLSNIYDIDQDDQRMRKMNELEKDKRAEYFDTMRKNYPVRREFNNYTVTISKNLKREINILKALRFNLQVY